MGPLSPGSAPFPRTECCVTHWSLTLQPGKGGRREQGPPSSERQGETGVRGGVGPERKWVLLGASNVHPVLGWERGTHRGSGWEEGQSLPTLPVCRGRVQW